MLRPWLPLAALLVLAAPLAWFWLGLAKEPDAQVSLAGPAGPTAAAGDVPGSPPVVAQRRDGSDERGPDHPLELPAIDPREAVVSWRPERLPVERLVLPDDDEPVLRLEEQVLGCDGPPVRRVVTVDRAGHVVEATYTSAADRDPAQRSERRVDPSRLESLLTALNEAGFFALELESRDQAAKEALLRAGAVPDDDPERRTSLLSVRLAGGSFSASATNVVGHVRRLPEFAELRSFELALDHVGTALAR